MEPNERVQRTKKEREKINIEKDNDESIEDNNIDYGNVWDSTKGYRGEGPMDSNEYWAETPKHIENKLIETTTIGHNIWKKAENKDINKGKIVSLNMQGWGANIERRLLWNQLTYMKAMIVVLIDHRRTQTQLKGIEAEARINWTGEQTKWKARWQHVPTHNSKVGGISIGIHPIISRYVIKETIGQDHRKWGRWTCTHIGGKNKIAIIGTYGPTKNEGEKENASMWRTQERKMQTIPREERKKDPKEQYIADIQKAITELKHKEYQVIILGDTNK